MEYVDKRIYGAELEVGLMGATEPGKSLSAFSLFKNLRIMDELPGEIAVWHHERSSNYFTEHGARWYLDINDTFEITTPECSSPDEIVAYDFAQQELLLGALYKLKADGRLNEFRMHTRVVDSVGSPKGAHESYSAKREISYTDVNDISTNALGTHLATRTIYTGAGMVGRRGNFCLAQKINSLREFVSATTTRDRGLINSRDEPLADKTQYRRLHLINGDPNICFAADKLKFGTTGLVLTLIENTEKYDIDLSDLVLADPLKAAKMVARDYRLSTQLRLGDGETTTALQIQRKYLEKLKLLDKRANLSPAGQDLIILWEETLDKLETDLNLAIGVVDWVTRLSAVNRRVEKRCLSTRESKNKYRRFEDMHFDLQGDETGSGVRIRQASMQETERAEVALAKLRAPSTRARLRGAIVLAAAQSKQLNADIDCIDWDYVRIKNKKFYMRDPFATNNTRIEQRLNRSSAA